MRFDIQHQIQAAMRPTVNSRLALSRQTDLGALVHTSGDLHLLLDRFALQTAAPTATPVPTQAPTPVDCIGDVTMDGTVDIVDALKIAQYYVGLIGWDPDFNEGCADTNCDGSVNIVDALIIAQYYVGLISQFC